MKTSMNISSFRLKCPIRYFIYKKQSIEAITEEFQLKSKVFDLNLKNRFNEFSVLTFEK